MRRQLHRDRILAAVLAVLLLPSLLVVSSSPAEARTDSSAEVRFVDSINAERARRGLPRLLVDNDLRSVARRHSVRMADRNQLYHNPNLTTDVSSWRRVTENIGRGSSVSSLHRALMSSEGHRANILDRNVSEVGIGVEVRGSTLWVTQVFRQPSTSKSVSFSDISSERTHGPNILELAESGVTMGCGSSRYCPGSSVTRDQMATFLSRAQALMPLTPGSFDDTPRSNVHSANIEAILHAGITTGCGTHSRYCPDRGVTRGEMASFLARSLELPKLTSRTRFSDVQEGSTHAAAIEAIARAGITTGCSSDRYCPDRTVTRAEMATFLVRAFDL